MFARIRVLVVDDSALIRQLLTRALALDPRIEIVGVATNGLEAIEKVIELDPDVVTLDIEMPELTGLEALPEILRRSEARVLMLSSLDDPDTTYQALDTGAVDFISKPKGGFASSLSEISDHLIKKIKTAYRIDPESMNRASLSREDAEQPSAPSGRAEVLDSLVVIAASTGGPPALEAVFMGLRASLPASYLVVQHLPAGFSSSLARRLSRVSDIPVAEATEGARLEPGRAYLAPHGRHMQVYDVAGSGPRIALEDGPSLHGVKPAADPLLSSASREFEKVVGVVLTGMGRDGVTGLGDVRRAGGHTIVQDEDTSVVWGMPGAAVAQGVADTVAPIGRIATEIRRAIREGERSDV